MKNKNLILKLIVFLLILSIGMGLSYGYFYFRNQQIFENIAKSKCLSISLSSEENDIRLEGAYPITDEDGKKLTPYSFIITNTCNSFISYEVLLESLSNSTLDSKYIKAMINREAITNLAALETRATIYPDSKEARLLAKGSLGSGESEYYTLRLWMDWDTPLLPETQNQTFESKVVVNATISNYSPIGVGITNLHDAILVNEYQVNDVETAIEKIAGKQPVDTTKIAPIIDWQENISPAPITNVVSAILPSTSLIGSSFDVTENETKIRLGKSYTLNSSTGYYSITDYDYYDPTKVNYGTTDYYFCSGGYNINENDKISTTYGTTGCTYIYKITGVSIDSKTTTATNPLTHTEYAVTRYLFTGYKLDQVELENVKSDRGLYQAEDDYGTSYYYRGSVKNNYVYFGGFYWQIIRINGDSSIRIMYAGSSPNSTGNTTYIKSLPFNTLRDNPGYVGYMYGSTLNTSLEQTQKNEIDSNVKKELETWYKTNIVDKGLDDYVADSGFCNDRSLSTMSNNGDGFTYPATKTTYYAANDRYYNTKTPTFKCANSNNDLFTTSTASVGNRSATYPIGLITVDELMYAGLANGYMNRLTYVYQNTYYWTMTPYNFNAAGSNAIEFYLNPAGGSVGSGWVTSIINLRPVINLKSDIQIISGLGTVDDPYVVKTA